MEIVLSKKITNLTAEEILSIYEKIRCLRLIESKRKNTIVGAWLELSYKEDFDYIERINIYKLITRGRSYDFIDFFKTFEETFVQKTDTKINLDDYILHTSITTQKIIIKTIVPIN